VKRYPNVHYYITLKWNFGTEIKMATVQTLTDLGEQMGLKRTAGFGERRKE